MPDPTGSGGIMVEGVEAAIEAIYAAGVDPAGWDAATRGIGAAFHTATGTLYVDRAARGAIEATVVSTFGHSPAAIGDYQAHFGAVNPFDRAPPDHFEVGEVVSDVDLDRRLRMPGAFVGTEYYCDWVRPQHLRHLIGGYVGRSEASRLVVAFWRPGDAGPWSDGETAAFGGIMRHVARAIDVGARLRTAEAEMEAVLGRSAAAVLTLAANGAVRHCNAAADALLRSGSALRVEAGRLRAAAPRDQAAFDRLVACVFDPRRAAWAENARLPLHRTDGGPPLKVRIAAAARRFDPFRPDRAASAILTVEGFEMEISVLADRLRRRFGMSPAQARLALTLRAGRTLQESAEELGVSRETVRSHLKAIFGCTGTRRQAELVLLLRRETGD